MSNFPSNDQSARLCGCDPGADHLCQQHREEAFVDLGADLIPPPTPWAPLGTIKDSGERMTFTSGSMRDPSAGKIKWSRITFGPMMRRWAQHLTTAEAKYPDPKPGLPNFMLIETEEELIRYKESAFRHFMSWWEGDTSEDHAAAIFFNVNGCEIIKNKQKAKESL
jgi:hypothetical protein